jgi:ABC-type transporter Mla maintaining outer membrane lipid asymmetry ATPase subunit MlaF
MTVSENVAYGLREGVVKAVGPREVWRRVIRALADVNLKPRLVSDKLPGELSGGMRKRGNLHATSVIVTHDVEGAMEICDRIGLLHHGRLRLVGTPDEFRRSRDPIVRAFTDRRQAEAASRALLDA